MVIKITCQNYILLILPFGKIYFKEIYIDNKISLAFLEKYRIKK